jgi:hypothetical protein
MTINIYINIFVLFFVSREPGTDNENGNCNVTFYERYRTFWNMQNFNDPIFCFIEYILSNRLSPSEPFSSPEPFSLGHSLKIRLWVRRRRDLIGFSEKCYFAEVEQFSLRKLSTQILRFFISSKYINTNTSFLRIFKIYQHKYFVSS